jgi:hypothetical protein
MLDAFIDVLGLEEKKGLVRRVFTNEEAEAAVSRGLIPIVLPYELSEQFNSIPLLEDDSLKTIG